MRFYFEFHFDQDEGYLAHLHDPLAAGVALDPELVTDAAGHRRRRIDRHADPRHDDRRLVWSLGTRTQRAHRRRRRSRGVLRPVHRARRPIRPQPRVTPGSEGWIVWSRCRFGWGSPVGSQLFGFEGFVDPAAVRAGARLAFQDEQGLAHSVAGPAVVDLAPACLLESTVRLVDRPLNSITDADTGDTCSPLTRPVAANRFRFAAGRLRPHIGEQFDTAGHGSSKSRRSAMSKSPSHLGAVHRANRHGTSCRDGGSDCAKNTSADGS